MKIGYRLTQPPVRVRSMDDWQAPSMATFARPIMNERDYREAKTLLARMMLGARTHEAAIRAEALLRELVAYEMRLDAMAGEDDMDVCLHELADEYEGPMRRWNDTSGE